MKKYGQAASRLFQGIKVIGEMAVIAAMAIAPTASAQDYFNTVKTKLQNGQQVVGGTISIANVDTYCAMANAGFDFLWIEMQHSPMTYSDVANMIRVCPGPAVPFIRVPDATEGDIQKAVDIGALGIIIPMVDTVEKVENAITYAMYPPLGKRSQGGGQYGSLWGRGYRQQANDNIMIVAMIENLEGVAIVEKIAGLEHVDVVFAASSDLSSFSGMRQGDPGYEALITTIKDATLAAGKYLAGPSAWKGTRDGYTFFQGGGETGLIRAGARQALGGGGGPPGVPRGVAPIEGLED